MEVDILPLEVNLNSREAATKMISIEIIGGMMSTLQVLPNSMVNEVIYIRVSRSPKQHSLIKSYGDNLFTIHLFWIIRKRKIYILMDSFGLVEHGYRSFFKISIVN